MPSIDIKRNHNLDLPEAKQAIQRVADHIKDKFSVNCHWQGNTLYFERSGVDGHIKVNPKSIHVVADLNFLLGALKGPIEKEIHQYLETEFK